MDSLTWVIIGEVDTGYKFKGLGCVVGSGFVKCWALLGFDEFINFPGPDQLWTWTNITSSVASKDQKCKSCFTKD